MRSIADSELYVCMSCGQIFLFSEVLFYFGFFAFSCGITLLVLTLTADTIGFGFPGAGIFEKLGYVVSAVVIILSFIIMHKSR